jgi:DUF1365 family protein
MFYLDLDELPELERQIQILGVNKPNLYSFHTSDHLPGSGKSLPSKDLKENVCQYLSGCGYPTPPARIMLLTHLRTLGYVFNPVSFYICFDADQQPMCAIAEVGNTFREIKPFVLPYQPDAAPAQAFEATAEKYFYISPFSALTNRMQFRMGVPGAGLQVLIDEIDPETGKTILTSAMHGKAMALNVLALSRLTLRYPLMPLQVIGMIHLQALFLFIKGLKVYMKEDTPHLQRGMFFPKFPRWERQKLSHAIHPQGD